jgi:FG-GAP-like repeat
MAVRRSWLPARVCRKPVSRSPRIVMRQCASSPAWEWGGCQRGGELVEHVQQAHGLAELKPLADLTGDHKADLVVHKPNDNSFVLATSTGSSFAGVGVAVQGWSKGDWAGLADVTGDGKADLVVHDPSNASFVVAVNDGSGRFNGGRALADGLERR